MDTIKSPLRQKQRGFVLTPLIDVIFLLLIFFMLSSQIAPYSLITVSGGVSGKHGPEKTTQTSTVKKDHASAETLFIVSRGHIRTSSATIPLDQLPEALKQFNGDKELRATVLTTKSASVQDIVTALEIFKNSQFSSVRLLMAPS